MSGSGSCSSFSFWSSSSNTPGYIHKGTVLGCALVGLYVANPIWLVWEQVLAYFPSFVPESKIQNPKYPMFGGGGGGGLLTYVCS